MASTVHHGVPRRFGWWYFQLKRMESRSFGDEKLIFRDTPGLREGRSKLLIEPSAPSAILQQIRANYY